jgi:hypothetical protein
MKLRFWGKSHSPDLARFWSIRAEPKVWLFMWLSVSKSTSDRLLLYEVLESDVQLFMGSRFAKSIWQLFAVSYPHSVPIALNWNYIATWWWQCLKTKMVQQISVKCTAFRPSCILFRIYERPQTDVSSKMKIFRQLGLPIWHEIICWVGLYENIITMLFSFSFFTMFSHAA